MPHEHASRIIVKNLPKHMTEARLREIFSTKGDITDIRLIKNDQGVFRKFAFVGYRTETEATSAVRQFDNTYVDTSKINVQLSKPYGDPELPRPWSKYSRGSSAFDKRATSTTNGSGKRVSGSGLVSVENVARRDGARATRRSSAAASRSEDDADPKFREFLELTTPPARAKVWTNEDGSVLADRRHGKKAGHISFDDDGRVILDGPTDDAFSSSDSVCVDGKVASIGPSQRASVDSDGSGVVNEPTMSLDDFVSRMTRPDRVFSRETSDSMVDSTTCGLGRLSPEELLLETGRLFVRNLSYVCTEEDLRKVFEPFGPLSEVHLSMAKDTQRPKGFAYILYMIPEHAVKAYAQLDGKIFLGRLLHLVPAAPKRDIESTTRPSSTSSYKHAQELKRKNATFADVAWNSLFMRSDTVAEAMASKLDIAKSELLDSGSDSVAVRLALSETQIIAETKRYLESEGVCLEAFSAASKKERSPSCILVKNLPFSMDAADLKILFGAYGDLSRVVLPPSRTIGLVEFANAAQAKIAFTHLAYTKFKDVPLYLEWAPLKVFVDKPVLTPRTASTTPPPSTQQQSHDRLSVDGAQTTRLPVTSARTILDESADDEPVDGTVIFVKNISFSTTDDTFRKTFEAVSGLKHATIVRKTSTRQPGHMLSTGFGFVEFKTHENALKAMKMFQNVHVDGHAWVLKFSKRAVESSKRQSPAAQSAKAVGTTKLLLRNVPFEASKKEMRELLSTFGQIKSMRLPKKLTGEHRGFCFVDFLTDQEAKHAFESLSSTHLYGRHLVIEWAKDDDSLSTLREKMTRQFLVREHGKSKKARIDMDDHVNNGPDRDDDADDDDDGVSSLR